MSNTRHIPIYPLYSYRIQNQNFHTSDKGKGISVGVGKGPELGNQYWKHCPFQNKCEIPEIEVSIDSNLNFTIQDFLWRLANNSDIYKKYEKHTKHKYHSL